MISIRMETVDGGGEGEDERSKVFLEKVIENSLFFPAIYGWRGSVGEGWEMSEARWGDGAEEREERGVEMKRFWGIKNVVYIK